MDNPRTRRSIVDKALDKAQKALQVGSEAADVLVHLQGGLTPLGLSAVGMRVVNSIREHRARTPQEYFSEGWVPLDLGALESNAHAALVADPAANVEPVAGLREGAPAVVVTVDGVTVGFATGREATRGCWIPADADANAVVGRLGRSLWDVGGSSRVGLAPVGDPDLEQLRLVATPEETLFESKRGTELYERVRRFLDQGYRRSIFVVGESGVGKSAMLRYVAQLHGGFILRVALADLASCRATVLARAVEVLRPDVLIIDDFDRFVVGSHAYNESGKSNPNADVFLDPVERIGRVVPLFMVSANFSDRITKALLRPERFDEVVLVDELDPELYARLLPDAPARLVAEIKRRKIPIAYVEELRKRAQVLGYDQASKEVSALIKRSGKILRLSKSKAARKGAPLSQKSPRQQAAILERRAAAAEKRAGSLIDQAAKLRKRGEDARARAKEQEAKKASKKKKAST